MENDLTMKKELVFEEKKSHYMDFMYLGVSYNRNMGPILEDREGFPVINLHNDLINSGME